LKYIDIHTHTYHPDPEVVQLVNVFPGELEKLELPALFSVGLHPWHVAENTWNDQLELVGSVAGNPAVMAIGEIGLDKKAAIPYNMQGLVFEKQLGIAELWNKPVIIHCVRSYSEMLFYRKKSVQSIPWIFHWFNARELIATELIRKNCYLSFGHLLFNPQSRACQLFRDLPLERIFLETDDAGYTIREVYHHAAAIRDISPEELIIGIRDNFTRCFDTVTGNGKLA